MKTKSKREELRMKYKDMYAYSVERIKQKINDNYRLRDSQPQLKTFYDGAIFGLFECLDMMKTDITVWMSGKDLKDIGLDFEPFDKKNSGTMFDDIDDEVTD